MTDYGSTDYGQGDGTGLSADAGYNDIASYNNNYAGMDNSNLFGADPSLGMGGGNTFQQMFGQGGYGGTGTAATGPAAISNPADQQYNLQQAQNPTGAANSPVGDQGGQQGQGGQGQGQNRNQGGNQQFPQWLQQVISQLSRQAGNPFVTGAEAAPAQQSTPDFANSPPTGYPEGQVAGNQFTGGPTSFSALFNQGAPDAASSIAAQMATMGGSNIGPQTAGGPNASPNVAGSNTDPLTNPQPSTPGQTTMPVSSLIAGGGEQQQNIPPVAGPNNVPQTTDGTTTAPSAKPAGPNANQGQPSPQAVKTVPYTPSAGPNESPSATVDGSTTSQGQLQTQTRDPLTNTIQQNLRRMGMGGLASVIAPLLAQMMRQRMGGRGGMPMRGMMGRGGMMMGRGGFGGRGRGRGGRGFGGFRGGMRLPFGMRAPVGLGNLARQAAGGGPGGGYPQGGDQATPDGSTPTSGPDTAGTGQPDYMAGSTPGQAEGMNQNQPGATPTGVSMAPAGTMGPASTFRTDQPAAPAGTMPAGQVPGQDASLFQGTPMGAPVTPGPVQVEDITGGDRTLDRNMQVGPPSTASDAYPGGSARQPGAAAVANGQPNSEGIPGRVVAGARQAAMSGGPGGVAAFMARNGHPKAGNWCGEFAAAVMHSQGIPVPRNPAVASNWRNWGQATNRPQAGDVAVRRFGRGGYVPTGATGSHVTMVVGVHPDGTMDVIGGNQSAMRERISMRGFDFRTMGPVPSPGYLEVARNPGSAF